MNEADASNHALVLLGVALGHTLWQGAIVWAVAAFGMYQARRRAAEGAAERAASSRAVYRTALLALVCIGLLPFINAFALSRAQTVQLAFAPPPPPVCPIHKPGDPMCDAHRGSTHANYLLLDGLPSEALGISRFAVEPAVQGYWLNAWDLARQAYASRPIAVAVAATWLFLASILALYHLVLWIVIHLRARHAAQTPPSEWQAAFDRLCNTLKLRHVQLHRADWTDTPVTFGWRHARVIMPAVTDEPLEGDTVAAALAHELVHVRRRDYLVNLGQIAVESLLFFHPAVWWLSERARTAREECCDDDAAALCTNADAYASALATLESGRLRGENRFSLAAARGSLTVRVRRILGLPLEYSSRDLWSPLGYSLTLAAPFFFIGLVGLRAHAADGPPARIVEFPPNVVGNISIRPAGAQESMTYSGWNPMGPAQGVVEIPAGMEARIDVAPNVTDMSFLANIPADAIQSVGFRGTQVQNADLAHIAHMTDLQELHMERTAIGDEGLREIQHINTLEYLDINRTQVTSAGVDYITGNTGMEILRITGIPLTDENMADFAPMTEIRLFESWRNEITDEGLAHMAGWTDLRTANLEDTQITSQGIAYLADLPHLYRINAQDTRLDDEALAILSQSSTLRVLNLIGTDITDAGLRFLARMPSLTALDLPIHIGPEGLKNLGNHPLAKTFQHLANAKKFSVAVTAQGVPVPYAPLCLRIEHRDGGLRLLTGENGECVFYLPEPSLNGSVSLRTVVEGYVAAENLWTPPLPERFTLDVQPADPIGGIVVDAAGNPLPGATVMLPLVDATNLYRLGKVTSIKTDETGQWFCPTAPPELTDFWAVVEHSGHAPSRYEMADLSLSDLRAMRQVLVVGGGLDLLVNVADAETNAPVKDAAITMTFTAINTLQKPRTAASGADGTAYFAEMPAEPVRLDIASEGYLPLIQAVELAEFDAPVMFALEKAGAIKGYVRDTAGKPLPEVRVMAVSNERGAVAEALTDSSGLFEVKPVPLSAHTLSVSRPGYFPVDAPAEPGDAIHEITLREQLHIVGAVFDGESANSVPQFDAYLFEDVEGVLKPVRSLIVAPEGNGFVMRLEESSMPPGGNRSFTQVQLSDGRMILTADTAPANPLPAQGASLYRVGVVAPGFMTALSPPYRLDDGKQIWDARVVRGQDDANTSIVTPDGKVAVGAVMAAYYFFGNDSSALRRSRGRPMPSRYAVIDGKVDGAGPVTTAANGRFYWPAAFPAPHIIVAHESGYAFRAAESAENWGGVIALTPWASINVEDIEAPKAMSADIPAMQGYDFHDGNSGTGITVPIRDTNPIEKSGAYVLQHLVSGQAILSWQTAAAPNKVQTHTFAVPLESGIPTAIAPTKEAVILRCRFTSESEAWANAQIQVTVALKDPEALSPPGYGTFNAEERHAWIQQAAALRGIRQYQTTARMNETVELEGILPGAYELSGFVSDPNGQSGYAFQQVVIPNGQAGQVIDIGDLSAFR